MDWFQQIVIEDEKQVEASETEEEEEDAWALVEPTKTGKDWSGKNVYTTITYCLITRLNYGGIIIQHKV